jgi:DNA-binding transcriptional MerR regulator
MDKATKSAEAFRTISEVSDILDVPQHVLRFWEGKFSQIKPMKRGGNRRYYRPEDLELLRAITHLLYTDGYTIKGVQKLLRENGVRATVNAHIAEHGAFQAGYDGADALEGHDEAAGEGDVQAASDNAAFVEAEGAPLEEEPALELMPAQAPEEAVSVQEDHAPDVAAATDLPDMAALPNAAKVIEELKAIQAILKP